MAASSQSLSFLLLSLLLISPSHSSVTKSQSHVKSEKVNLSLYYESLCPYCRNFIVSQLVKVFNTDLLNIIHLKLLPWGNAQVVKPNNTVTCQVPLPFFYLICIYSFEFWHLSVYCTLLTHFGLFYSYKSSTVKMSVT